MNKEIELQSLRNYQNEEIQLIIELIGENNSLKLIKELGGVSVYFPKMDVVTRAVRDKLIYIDFQGGMCYKNISRKYQISESRVRKIIKYIKDQQTKAK